MQEREIRGVVAVVPVPFAADETVDEASLRTTVGWLAERRVGGLCLPAYGSEFYKLSEAERERVVAVALEANRRRLPLVAQANHGSSRIAAATARRYEELGADLIAFAIPRQFASSEADLLRYCGRIADAVSVPVLIQDFNPGGQTIGPDFIDALNRAHPNFRYAKLEEPLIADKLVAIRERVGDRVRVLEGWGGFYMLEAIPAGICGSCRVRRSPICCRSCSTPAARAMTGAPMTCSAPCYRSSTSRCRTSSSFCRWKNASPSGAASCARPPSATSRSPRAGQCSSTPSF